MSISRREFLASAAGVGSGVMSPRAAVVTNIILLLSVVTPVTGVELWYDFEGDTGAAIDRLTGDGSQNGTLQNNVSIDATAALFGSQGALFAIPAAAPEVNPPYSTLEIPGSTALGEDFTIALHINNQESPLDFTRVFSSFGGTGAVGAGRILCDYDASGSVITGARVIINNTVVGTNSVPAGLATPGYHHFAVTVDSGAVELYVDGISVASGNVGLGYSNVQNIFIGEDPHDLGGSANEQLVGDVDEVLVINRALSQADIQMLAGGTSVSAQVVPAPGEYAVYYDFEGDSGSTVVDKFQGDGAHNGMLRQNASVGSTPYLGASSGRFDRAVMGSPFSQIEVGQLGNLGSRFTMSASIDIPQPGHAFGDLTRVFSTFGGSGSPANRLLFDFDPDASLGVGVRFFLPDGTFAMSLDTVSLNERHTLTATYDDGDLRIYLDGLEIASAVTAGDVDLGAFPLFIGEDNPETFTVVNENFIGSMDDVFIIERALTPSQVMLVHQLGAAATFQLLEIVFQNGFEEPGPP